MRKISLLASSAMCSAASLSMVAIASPALAQATTPPAATDQAAPAAAPTLPPDQPTASENKDVVVTGSRIRTVTPFNSPDPITIIDPAVSRNEGKFDVATMLQSSPIAAGSTQITSALSSNFVTAGGPGAQTISLRGLGANRTLVLLNGRRAGPAGTRGSVSSFDLNVLPQSIVSDIQIVKTGASSIYGSDAVAGVVNIITKTDTNGLQLNANVGVPTQSGGEEYRLNAIWGKRFTGGHILLAADYSHTAELARGDRSYLACPEAYTFRQDGSRADLVDPRTGQYKCEDLRWGHVWTYDTRAGNLRLDGPGGPNTGANTAPGGAVQLLQFQYPGENLGIPAFGAPTSGSDFSAPAGWFPTGYNAASLAVQNAYHPFVEQQSIIPKTDLFTIYAEGAYNISDSVELFGEFLYNRRTTYQNGWRQFWSFGVAAPYNIWANGFTGGNLISPTGITNHSDSSQRVDYFRGVGGLRGDFGNTSKWHWEVYGQYSKSVGRYRTEQILQDVYNISVSQGFGSIGSCVGMVTPISKKNCIDLPFTNPFFLRGEMTQAQVDYLFSWEEGRTLYTQATGEASLTGELFHLPGGPIGVALGVDGRKDAINDTPGAITLAGNAWGTSTSGITAGNSVTLEAFGELNLPVLKDIPAIRELTFSAAGRVTNVKSTRASDGLSASDNGNFTYKLGANWAVTDWFRFRGSYGTSFRAPALFEQFLTNETSSPTQASIDPCIQTAANLANGSITQRIFDNCSAAGIPTNHSGAGVTATSIAQGGLGVLKSETSKALVVGGILTPKFSLFGESTRLSLAVDYFSIEVKGEVSQLGARNILFGCYSSVNFPTDPLCSLFTRGQTGAPENVNTVQDKFVNISTQKNRGLDVTFNARQDLGRFGKLSFTADMTWTFRNSSQLLPTSPAIEANGLAGAPRWVGDFRATYSAPGNLTVFYGINVVGGTSNVQHFIENNGSINGQACLNSSIRGIYCPVLTVPAVFYHNASVTQDVGDKFTITLGLNNIFDTRPPRVSTLNGSEISTLGPVVATSQYGFIGRKVFVNVTARF
ncbi:MAG: TonB-dependent outer rane channel [Sphingomonas bacterium]|uniref:TonB-dependent receptor domain-containing protein n=1 Tax=Sphingomonas bacterium TaxID=1895847 RepID=UPI00261F7919|nr:TonB-dependent receptor [Sphingomonas bacterium]MDB5711706.1 TonB-dependent outer rane channel [Sphingomonas bacterium]